MHATVVNSLVLPLTDAHSDKYFRYFEAFSFCIAVVGTLPNVVCKPCGTCETCSSHYKVSKCTLDPSTDTGILVFSTWKRAFCSGLLLLGFERKAQLLCFARTFGIISALLYMGREGVDSSKLIWLRLPQLLLKVNC